MTEELEKKEKAPVDFSKKQMIDIAADNLKDYIENQLVTEKWLVLLNHDLINSESEKKESNETTEIKDP